MKKLLVVGVIFLFLSLTVAPSINANKKSKTTDISRIFVRGVILFPHLVYPCYKNLKFFAIRLWTLTYTPTNRTQEVYWFTWVTLRDYGHNRYLDIFQNRWMVLGFLDIDDIIIHT